MKQRLDKALVERGLAITRSQAESDIRLGDVLVNGQLVRKPGKLVVATDELRVTRHDRYVSRAGLKLASVARQFAIDWADAVVLDIGSSTGGFTDFALQQGAQRVIAVDVGTDQLHPKLRADKRVELHEKTDIRDFLTDQPIDIIVGDVSFISLRHILPYVAQHLMGPRTTLLAMVKPQFEAGPQQVHKGVIKNKAIRRTILFDFEQWAQRYFHIVHKQDSRVAGAKGNLERFYALTLRGR